MGNLLETLKNKKLTNSGEQRIVALIDLLGFTSALENESNFEKLVELLIIFSKNNNNFQVAEGQEENSFKVQPSITAISDTIIISYPLETLPITFWLLELKRYISFFALISLYNGFLIRGSIAQRRLYHQDGVLVGNPLIEANKLEKNDAKMPRIIVPKTFAEQYDLNKRSRVVKKGESPVELKELPFLKPFEDSSYSMRYIPEMLRIGISPGDSFLDNIKNRVSEIKSIILNNKTIIQTDKRFQKNRKDILEKWNWHEEHFKEESDFFHYLKLKKPISTIRESQYFP